MAAAIAFRREGHKVTVFERAAGPSSAGGAISLAPNALRCLKILSVDDHLSTHPWSDMPATIRNSSGRVLVRSTMGRLTGGAEFACVPRAQLISWLTAALPPTAFVTSARSALSPLMVSSKLKVLGISSIWSSQPMGPAASHGRRCGRGHRGSGRPGSPDGRGSPIPPCLRDSAQSGGTTPISESSRCTTAAPTCTAEPPVVAPISAPSGIGRNHCQASSPRARISDDDPADPRGAPSTSSDQRQSSADRGCGSCH
ncbi:hypothetical protein H7I76_22240, partial [Mycolicibacterium vaccae]|nr:hypothetical protein [Mycolicibacterium vaccae]